MFSRRMNCSKKKKGHDAKTTSLSSIAVTQLETDVSRTKTKTESASLTHSSSSRSCTQTNCESFLDFDFKLQSMETDFSDSYSGSKRFDSLLTEPHLEPILKTKKKLLQTTQSHPPRGMRTHVMYILTQKW